MPLNRFELFKKEKELEEEANALDAENAAKRAPTDEFIIAPKEQREALTDKELLTARENIQSAGEAIASVLTRLKAAEDSQPKRFEFVPDVSELEQDEAAVTKGGGENPPQRACDDFEAVDEEENEAESKEAPPDKNGGDAPQNEVTPETGENAMDITEHVIKENPPKPEGEALLTSETVEKEEILFPENSKAPETGAVNRSETAAQKEENMKQEP
ncbi:MAG: hypothetical protein GX061_00020, partial [Eubacteriaceae bacterium]|nr:hypothetical protein [Eubacteriaceae bacterium]